MLAELAVSELSCAAFCREYGVARHRVDYWRKRLANRVAGGFVAVDVVSSAPAAPVAPAVEVVLESGRKLRFTGAWGADALAPWLQALGNRS